MTVIIEVCIDVLDFHNKRSMALPKRICAKHLVASSLDDPALDSKVTSNQMFVWSISDHTD
jgi:hypothetical protein